ncbi:MAG: hypothetical protein Pg6A_08850 [Termitinemataceae bacterium]|nr:MAG: hypothetical protein Pg6A_08850 [Termitinemataceae bacterium]
MRKSLWPRILIIICLYAAIFLGVAVVQFMSQDGFNRRVGSLILSGRYKFNAAFDDTDNADPNEIPVENAVSVFFGGLEFKLSGGTQENLLSLIDFDGIRRPLIPKSMIIDEYSVRFKLSGGSVLAFYVQNKSLSDELIISSHLAEDALSIELPYRLTKNSTLDSKTFAVIHNKQKYNFDRAIADNERQLIVFDHKNPVISYRVLNSGSRFNPANFIISDAMGKQFYDDIVAQWRSSAFFEWNSNIGSSNDELEITAFISESARRNNYNKALASISEDFINSTSKSYLPSTFTGQLEGAARNMGRVEQERISAIEKLVKNRDEILKQHKLFDFLLQRSKNTLFDEAIAMVKQISPDSITLADCPGALEGWWAFETWHKSKENPFGLLANRAKLLLSENLIKENDVPRVFVRTGNTIDVFFSIRLGMALAAYGDLGGSAEWAAVGRSIVLSVLSFAGKNASLPASLISGEDGRYIEQEDGDRLQPGFIYPYLNASDFYPHVVGAGTVMFGVWLWTSSPSVGASYRNNTMEFGITFPLNSPHYLIICGIRPFSRIQIRGMDYRSDQRFESYNSPGWVYLPGEQMLLLKLVHKNELESIKIYFTQ